MPNSTIQWLLMKWLFGWPYVQTLALALLTHWDKRPPFRRRYYQMHFLEWEIFKSQIIFQWNMFQWVKNTCLTTIVSKIQSTCFIWTIRTCIRRFPIWIRFNFLWGDDWELFDRHRHAWIMLQQNNMCNSSWDRYLIRVKYVARVLACVTFAATSSGGLNSSS